LTTKNRIIIVTAKDYYLLYAFYLCNGKCAGYGKATNHICEPKSEPNHISILTILDNISASKPTNSNDSYFDNFAA